MQHCPPPVFQVVTVLFFLNIYDIYVSADGLKTVYYMVLFNFFKDTSF